MSEWGISDIAARLHKGAIVWDTHAGFSPQPGYDLGVLDRWHAVGTTFLSVNAGFDRAVPWEDVIRTLASVRRWILDRPDRFLLAGTVADVRRAKEHGRMAVGFDLEGANALDGRIEMVELYHRLGVRQMLLAYNVNNALGGGCHDEEIALTPFGREVVAEMNRVGMVVDCSHMGYRSTMEMLELSSLPVVFSHSNPLALCDHGRNIRDEQIKACAATGGVIGINGFGLFLGGNDITTGRIVRHIDYIVQLVGPTHVGLGFDYLPDEDGAAIMAAHPENWPGYAGNEISGLNFAKPEQLPEVTQQLLDLGYGGADVKAILGENFLRVATATWR